MVEDNPYGLLGFDGDPMPAMRSLDEDRVVYLGSFSKTFAPGFRVGWVLAPHAVREKLVLAQESATLCPPVFSQFAVAAYLANHDWRGQIKVFREMYRERRDAMLAGLADHMPAGTTWTGPPAASSSGSRLPPGLDSQAMLPRAVTARVAYVPGTAFYADGFGSRHMRLSYCFPTPERILEGTRRLGEVLQYEAGVLETFGAACPDRRPGRPLRPVRGARSEPDMIDTQHERRPDRRETVVVLAGGLSHERDVSLRSGRRVSQALRSRGRRRDRVRRRLGPGATAGRAGRRGGLPAAARRGRRGRRAARGARPARGAVRRLGRLRLPGRLRQVDRHHRGRRGRDRARPPRSRCRTRSSASSAPQALVAALGEQIGFPMMVKPSRGGSALGCSKVNRAEELPAAMVGAYAYGPVAVVEQFVAGTEVTVAVVDRGAGPRRCPPWRSGPTRASTTTPPATPPAPPGSSARRSCRPRSPTRCADLALRVHDELGLRDLSRTDLIITADGEPVFLEVNVAPGMTETSAVPLAIEAAGWSLGKMCADLVRRGRRAAAPSRPPPPVTAGRA